MRAQTAPGRLAVSPRMPATEYWPRAEWIVLAMLAVVALRVHEFFPLARFIKPVLSASIFGTIILIVKSAPGVRVNTLRTGLGIMVVLYFAFILLTVPFAIWPGRAFETARAMLPSVLLFAGFQFCAPTRRNVDRLQTGLVALALFSSWYQQTFGFVYRGRLLAMGGTYDPNDVASVLAFAFPFALGTLTRTQENRARVVAALAVVALVLGIIATGSRGGTLAFAAGAIVYVAGLKAAKAMVVVYFMILGGGAAWIGAPPAFRSRMLSLTNLENDYNLTSESGRKAVWKRGRGYFLDNPVIGVGAGNFEMAEGAYLPTVGQTGKWSAAHNAYLQAFVELGSIGGGLFVLMLLTGARTSLHFWRKRPTGRGPPFRRPEYLAALGAFCASAYFLSHAYHPPLFGLLGIIALAHRTREAERAGIAPAGPTIPRTVMTVRTRGERGGLASRVAGSAAALQRRIEPPGLTGDHRIS